MCLFFKVVKQSNDLMMMLLFSVHIIPCVACLLLSYMCVYMKLIYHHTILFQSHFNKCSGWIQLHVNVQLHLFASVILTSWILSKVLVIMHYIISNRVMRYSRSTSRLQQQTGSCHRPVSPWWLSLPYDLIKQHAAARHSHVHRHTH